MTSELNMSHGKMSNLVSFPLFVLTLVIKLRSFDFKSHLNSLIILIKEISDLNMSYEKMSGFLSSPLFGFTLVIKLRNFYFEGY